MVWASDVWKNYDSLRRKVIEKVPIGRRHLERSRFNQDDYVKRDAKLVKSNNEWREITEYWDRLQFKCLFNGVWSLLSEIKNEEEVLLKQV